MRKRNPELFWNAETTARAFDVSRARLMQLARLELVPMPVVLKDEPLWYAKGLRGWAHKLGAANPAEAVACLWARWQNEELEALERGHA